MTGGIDVDEAWGLDRAEDHWLRESRERLARIAPADRRPRERRAARRTPEAAR